LVEFTGERLIPDQVNVDLLNEHMARYAFAVRLARGKRVLDAGCGAGYGCAELAHTAVTVLGADIAAEAIEFARAHYRLPNLHFEQASCTDLPHADGCFDLVVAFEVIEHLANWREFLLEARRVLAPSGQFIVSTPNKRYYTESRGTEGANPFHVHEFEFEEFREELADIFPNVALFLENHVEGVTFQPFEPENTVEVRVDAAEPSPNDSHFFVAVCAHRPQLGNPTFVYVPRAANVLRERGRHIALLEQELVTKNTWLEKAAREHEELLVQHRSLQEELERGNRWAQSLNQELEERRARVGQLQDELRQQQETARQMAEGYAAKVKELEQELEANARWVAETEARLHAEMQTHIDELGRAVEALHRTEKELEERTAWARRLEEEGRRLDAQLSLVRASRWVKLGRKVGLGPDLPFA
jgi:SAM-dependent methyltransferase